MRCFVFCLVIATMLALFAISAAEEAEVVARLNADTPKGYLAPPGKAGVRIVSFGFVNESSEDVKVTEMRFRIRGHDMEPWNIVNLALYDKESTMVSFHKEVSTQLRVVFNDLDLVIRAATTFSVILRGDIDNFFDGIFSVELEGVRAISVASGEEVKMKGLPCQSPNLMVGLPASLTQSTWGQIKSLFK